MCFQSHKCQVLAVRILILLLAGICITVLAVNRKDDTTDRNAKQIYSLGECKIVLDQPCPDENVKFFLYNKMFPNYSQPIKVGETVADSNITDTLFSRNLPVKIIVHGYNSDMNLSALQEIRSQYLHTYDYNIFMVDWSVLCPAPCYPTAVYNTRHVGKCMAQLVKTIRELGAQDIHVIGFSLGAHVANYLANSLKPYKLPRITGLDPAMPGFTFVTKENKLDAGDAEFVDVIHTNAFIQGTIQTSGHVDFYMNGGIIQPGCWAERRFFACNHHRAPLYYAESINSDKGFWGWPCTNYFMYLIGQCPPADPQVLVGAFVNKTARGMHLAITGSVSPYAVGKFDGPTIEIIKNTARSRKEFMKKVSESQDEDLIKELAKYGLDGYVKNINNNWDKREKTNAEVDRLRNSVNDLEERIKKGLVQDQIIVERI